MTPQAIATALLFLSQTEANAWAGCHLQAWARHVLGYRPPDDENLAQRVGSVGHALTYDRLDARWHARPERPDAAVERERARRGWQGDLDVEVARAAPAVDALWRALDLDDTIVMPDLYSAEGRAGAGGPLAERRLAVPWRVVREAVWDPLEMPDCPHVYRRYAGIEGTPDLVMMPGGAGGPVVVADYKFRQKPDLGGAVADPGETIPNRQAAWYLVLLRAAKMHAPAGFEFWQANVFAGRRLVADDFVRVAGGGADGDAEAGLVVSSGLPTRDLSRIGECGMVSPEEWAEAHRVLANLRHDRRMAEWRNLPPPPAGSRRKPPAPPERLTAAEEADARRMVMNLRAVPEVVVRRVPADPFVCRELVRDMIVGVEAPLALAMRGMTPARNLQDHRGSNCVRPYGCPIANPCKATIGTWNIRRTLQDMHTAGMLARDGGAPPAPLGHRPATATATPASTPDHSWKLWDVERYIVHAGRMLQLQERDGRWRMVDEVSMAILSEGDDREAVRAAGFAAAERMPQATE